MAIKRTKRIKLKTPTTAKAKAALANIKKRVEARKKRAKGRVMRNTRGNMIA